MVELNKLLELTGKDVEIAATAGEKLSQNLPNTKQVHSVSVEDVRCGSINVVVPNDALHLFVELLKELGQGKSVAVTSYPLELTVQEAADYLEVSKDYLGSLLEEGKIPSFKAGPDQYINFRELMNYREEILSARKEALNELTKLSQDLKLGY